MVLRAGAGRERGGGRHPGRGGLRAGSIRSILAVGRGLARRVRELEGEGRFVGEMEVCRKQEARVGLDQKT